MPTDIKRLEGRLFHSRWFGKLTAEEVLADQKQGNQMARDAHETDFGLIIEIEKGIQFPVDFRLVRMLFTGDTTPTFVVIIGANTAIKTIASTIEKLFTRGSYVYYALDLANAISIARKRLNDLDTKKSRQSL